MRTSRLIAMLFAAMIAVVSSAQAAEYFVSKQGSDANAGTSRTAAFLTIQKGVNALKPGDTLTITPGEYSENVKLQNFGDINRQTLIQAEVPGTVVLRGDRNVDSEFAQVTGQRFVYVADCPEQVLSVHEADTITNLAASADAFALEFGPGRFYYDSDARKLYLSSSDFKSPDQHRYTMGVLKDHGFHMFKCRGVVLDGLAASAYRTAVGKDVLLLPVSGFMLHECAKCVVRNCTAYFNGSGITINSGVGSNINQPGEGRGNLVEDCVAYANDLDGIVAYNPSGETIRNCRSFLNQTYGARFYGGRDGDDLCLMEEVIAWGNPGGDYWTKGGKLSGFFKEVLADRCVAFRGCMFGNFQHGLIGGGAQRGGGDRSSTIDLPEGHKEFLAFLDTNFADPLNYDFRFQSTSKYAKPGRGAAQRGLYPYKANVYYVKTDGNDTRDGLSMENAWKTPASALGKLKPGDTLYIAPGFYKGDLALTGRDIRIRGRGLDPVVIEGGLRLVKGENVRVERLQFFRPVQLFESSNVDLSNCAFAGAAVQADAVSQLKLTHNVFAGVLHLAGCSGVSLSGNIYAASPAPAVQLDSLDAITYSSYNSYPAASGCWEVGGKTLSLAELRPRNDAESVVVVPDLWRSPRGVGVTNAHQYGGRGPLSTAIGPYREWKQKPLQITGPFVKSTTGTSADIEWWTTVPVQLEFAWGDTPACTRKKSVAQNAYYSYSVNGLQPGRTYHVKVTPTGISAAADPARRFVLSKQKSEPVAFTPVAGKVHQPTTYYVAPDGDDAADGLSAATPWKSVQIAANRVRPGDTVLLGSGVYPGTFYFRTTGEADKPITFKAAPGARVWIHGMGETLHAGFILYGKHHYRIDSLYFNGYAGIEDNVGGKEGGAIYARNSDDLQITRCSFSQGWGRCLEPHECANLQVRNCVFMSSMEAVMMYSCPDVLIENSVFISPLITHLHAYTPPGSTATVRRCIFGENTRHKVHVCPVSVGGVLSDNCYFMRWSQYDRLVAQGKTFPQLQAAGETGSLYANPMMPGAHGFRQGWQQINNDYKSDDPYTPIDFNRLFPTNPEVVLRDIGLQAEAFRDFHFWKKDWPYDKEWAARVKDCMAAAEALSKAGQHAKAATAYVDLVMSAPMSDRLKTDVIDRAAQCASLAGEYERAMKLAKNIPLKPFAVRRQMAVLGAQKKFGELISQFSDEALGASPHTSWFFPETEQLLGDILYYRSIAYAQTGKMAAAEKDLRTMVEHGSQLGYSPGASVMAVAWKRLGDFYASAMKDKAKALEAYNKALETKSNPEISGALDAARKAVTELQGR